MTAPYYVDESVTLHSGDCLQLLRAGRDLGYDFDLGYEQHRLFPDRSVDAIVTDPPYDLTSGKKGGSGAASVNLNSPHGRARISTGQGGFMGKSWDATGVAFKPETWAECLRVLKPGGHLLAFGGSRTWHRLASAVEDAGFEIRDSIAWLYGSGFPKSLDVSKAIDKARDDSEAILVVTTFLADAAEREGFTRADVDACMGTSDMASWWLSRLRHRCQCPTWDQWVRLKSLLSLTDAMDAEVWRLNGRKGTPGPAWSERAVIGAGFRVDRGTGAVPYGSGTPEGHYDITASATDAAREWQGWGTALKPAFEPIVVGRKPLIGTVAANVQQHGTGALNIDACRTATSDDLNGGAYATDRTGRAMAPGGAARNVADLGQHQQPSGRWPTNVVLDESQAEELDRQTGIRKAGGSKHGSHASGRSGGLMGRVVARDAEYESYGDSGGASRFFPTFRYEAKAPTSQRPTGEGGAAHPTVKPLDLMRWLVRLVTPPGGIVLDPFAGSGTTLEACLLEGFRSIGIEREADYLPLIRQRLAKPLQAEFGFDEVSA